MYRLNAASVYLIKSGIIALASSIMFTTYALYYITMLGLNPLQLVLVGTLLEGAMVAFELPTAIVADAYSRRLSVLIGTLVLGVAFVLEGSVPLFGRILSPFVGILIAELIRGVGESLISGADEAWITDEVGAAHVGPLFMRASQVGRIMSFVGIGISVLLANVSLNLPYMIGGALYLGLTLFLALTMPETGFKPRPRAQGESHWQMMGTGLMAGLQAIRGQPVLIALLLVGMISGMATEGIDRLWEAHFLITFKLAERVVVPPATAFGILAAISALVALVAIRTGERWVDFQNRRLVTVTLLLATGLRAALGVTFALAPTLVMGVGALLLFQSVSAVALPIYRTWLNQHLEPETRATVLSLVNQTDALGQMTGGPLVGWVGARFTLRASLVMGAIALAPAVGVYGWALRRGRPKAAPKEVSG